MNELRHEDWTLSRAVDAIMAWDAGALDSGASDGELRKEVAATLKDMTRDGTLDAWASDHARRILATPGYGIEDVVSFLNWLGDEHSIHF